MIQPPHLPCTVREELGSSAMGVAGTQQNATMAYVRDDGRLRGPRDAMRKQKTQKTRCIDRLSPILFGDFNFRGIILFDEIFGLTLLSEE